MPTFAHMLQNRQPSVWTQYLAEMVMVWVPVGIYHSLPYYQWFLNPRLQACIWVMASVYTVYAWFVARAKVASGEVTKGILMGRFLSHVAGVIIRRKSSPVVHEERTAFLAFLVKAYYIPVMLNFTYRNLANLKYYVLHSSDDFSTYQGISLFNHWMFPLLVSLCYVTLTLVYLFGYVVEMPALNNRVKSVDTTLLGWAVTLACYPPFSNEISRHVPFEININASFGTETLTMIVRLVMLALMGMMFWSVAVLGVRCSNLTNRGIITTGPYKIIRHPHYMAKNLMWWFTILPAIPGRPIVILYMALWTAIYLLRGITEEMHLKSDPAYQAYCQQVRWKFIPGIW